MTDDEYEAVWNSEYRKLHAVIERHKIFWHITLEEGFAIVWGRTWYRLSEESAIRTARRILAREAKREARRVSTKATRIEIS